MYCQEDGEQCSQLQKKKSSRMDETENAIALVTAERERQFELYGDQSGKSLYEFIAILGEEFGELCEAVSETYMMGSRHPERGGKDNIVKEAVHVAAVAVQLIEVMIHRKNNDDSLGRIVV